MKHLLHFLLVISLFSFADAQKPSRGRSAVPSSSHPYATAPFTYDATVLPPNYKGHDLKRLYKAIGLRNRDKGEFESTGVYKERLKKEMSLPFIGDMDVLSTYAFQVKITEASYDADLEEYLISAKLDYFFAEGAEKNLKALASTEDENMKESHHAMVNGFGARVMVTSKEYDAWELAVTNWLIWKSGKDGFSVKLNADPKTAQRHKSNLRLLAVVNLEPPLVSTKLTGLEAKYDSPYEYFFIHKYIHVKLQEIWLYDFPTGKILKKLQPPPVAQ